jgi:predicted dehydrogenase
MKTCDRAKSYESLGICFFDPKIDAAANFTPASVHFRHSVAALRAGKHVLCVVPAG